MNLLFCVGKKPASAFVWNYAIVIVTASMNSRIDMKTFIKQSEVTDKNLSQLIGNQRSITNGSQWVFGYEEDNGPHVWSLNSRYCAGKRQSPINLDTTTSLTKTLPRLHWWNYNIYPRRVMLENNGHTVTLKGTWKNSTEVPCFWLSSEEENDEMYVFDQLHFHWGQLHSAGSEHTLNSISYSLEMHVVHHNKRFHTLNEALLSKNNVIVVAILYRLSRSDNSALAPIITALKHVRHAGAEVSIKPFSLRSLLPEFSKYFLMYNGSLTTPPCTETVSWVVKLEPSTISMKQLAEFQFLKTERNKSLSKNCRPVQPPNGRTVWHIK